MRATPTNVKPLAAGAFARSAALPRDGRHVLPRAHRCDARVHKYTPSGRCLSTRTPCDTFHLPACRGHTYAIWRRGGAAERRSWRRVDARSVLLPAHSRGTAPSLRGSTRRGHKRAAALSTGSHRSVCGIPRDSKGAAEFVTVTGRSMRRRRAREASAQVRRTSWDTAPPARTPAPPPRFPSQR